MIGGFLVYVVTVVSLPRDSSTCAVIARPLVFRFALVSFVGGGYDAIV
jgi:hypothetical protein